MTTPARVLLGPQQDHPTVASALERLGGDGLVGLISAGWRELEGDPARIDPSWAPRARSLPLYQAAERVWEADPELAEGHHAMQRAVKTARRAYNIRLAHLMDAALSVGAMEGAEEDVQRETLAALEAVRRLDYEHRARVASLRANYAEGHDPFDRPAVRAERERLMELMDGVDTVVVEGGHVAVLLNRLRLFGLAPALAERNVIACSGGAMVLSADLVLFHDRPPQGPGHPELAESGIGLVEGVVVLPHAQERLELDDPGRVSRFARRFAPSVGLVFDEQGQATLGPNGWSASSVRALRMDGSVTPWEGAA